MNSKLYNKKIDKVSKKFSKLTSKLFSKWGEYIENIDWNNYKDIEFASDFNFEFDIDEAIKISNTVMFNIPSIQDINIEELKKNLDSSRELYQSNAGLYLCMFNRRYDNRPFRKIDNLNHIQEYIKNFPEFYTEICDVFIKNHKLICINYKEAKLSNMDKNTVQDYLNILDDYKKYNNKLFNTFSYILKRSYMQNAKMYGAVASHIKYCM